MSQKGPLPAWAEAQLQKSYNKGRAGTAARKEGRKESGRGPMEQGGSAAPISGAHSSP